MLRVLKNLPLALLMQRFPIMHTIFSILVHCATPEPRVEEESKFLRKDNLKLPEIISQSGSRSPSIISLKDAVFVMDSSSMSPSLRRKSILIVE